MVERARAEQFQRGKSAAAIDPAFAKFADLETGDFEMSFLTGIVETPLFCDEGFIILYLGKPFPQFRIRHIKTLPIFADRVAVKVADRMKTHGVEVKHTGARTFHFLHFFQSSVQAYQVTFIAILQLASSIPLFLRGFYPAIIRLWLTVDSAWSPN